MSDTVVLKADVRKESGSKHSVQLRRAGKLPAIVYGHKQEPVNLSFDLHDFTETLHHGHRIVDVQVDGGSETMMIKALQYDYLGKYIIHADMMRVDLSERVKVSVAIEQKGTSLGSHSGGIIDELLNQIQIECMVSEIPDSIVVSIKELDIGDSVHARDIELPEGAVLMTDPNALVLHCHEVAAAISAEDGVEGEEAAEPEVITERATDESEGDNS